MRPASPFFRLLGPAHRACQAHYSFRNRFRPYLLTKLVFITPPSMRVLPLSQKSLAPLRAACWDNAALGRALAQDVARACAAVGERYAAATQQLERQLLHGPQVPRNRLRAGPAGAQKLRDRLPRALG